ncbi:hypothetical protein niasHS_017356 [Heterodera schachtii]|uniref:Uncharacterized protein n=1 Tax=Heterodera schachtii TaxID=97005 RepID=A0ABD2HVK6_HETSC
MIEPRTSLTKFAAELFNTKAEFVQCIVLTRADKREKLIMELRKADFNGEEKDQNSAKRADGRLKLMVKANANQNRVLAIKGVVKLLNESILDESDEDNCGKSNQKAEKVNNTKRRNIVYECHECQPSTTEQWRSFPPTKWQESTDQMDRQAQDLARTAAEAMDDLANHIRQPNPD